MRNIRRAFTLIELLVVVTIIVVLLALLSPALEKAVYQAQLAVCGANLKSFGSGVTTYATGQRRAYPVRHTVQAVPTVEISDPWYDLRPTLMDYMPIDALLDPLSAKVDLSPEASDPDALVFSGYCIYAGGGFTGQAAMRRLGDRWWWTDGSLSPARSYSFSVLAGCRDARADLPVDPGVAPGRRGLHAIGQLPERQQPF